MGMTNDGLSFWQAEAGNEPLLESTIGDLLDQRASELSSQEAVVYSGYPEFGGALDIRWTYQQYRDQANMVARGLMALGLQKGDHIAVWAANVPEWPLLQMAAAKAGLVLVTVNPVLRAAEIEYLLKQGDVRALFFMAHIRDHNCVETMRALTTPGAKNGEVTSERLPKLRYLCLVGATPPALLESQEWRPAAFREFVGGGMAVSADALAERQASLGPNDPAMILYTSGTTGFPKGAVLTHYNLVNQAMTVASRLGLEHGSRSCVMVPFFHVFGCVGYTLAGLYLGGTIHPLLAYDPLKAMQIISSERCNFSGGVPTMLLAMLQHPDFGKYDLSSLNGVVCAGAPVPVALMEQVKERIGADVVIAFGQTENTGAITLTLREDPFELKAATVGKALPYVDVKIIDPATGEVVPVGERGELCARGWLVMASYYNMPERSAEAVDQDGWLHTGDLATIDSRGYINIVGRIKDMVIRGGENIFPREVEEFLIRHPKVADVAVLGVPDAFFGEELLAVVMPKTGETLTEEELRAYCTGQISKQKIPRYFKFTEVYPMTASGKVQKFILREQAIKELGLEAVAQQRTA
jgi:fatty-acyl-CoA synthase